MGSHMHLPCLPHKVSETPFGTLGCVWVLGGTAPWQTASHAASPSSGFLGSACPFLCSAGLVIQGVCPHSQWPDECPTSSAPFCLLCCGSARHLAGGQWKPGSLRAGLFWPTHTHLAYKVCQVHNSKEADKTPPCVAGPGMDRCQTMCKGTHWVGDSQVHQ